MSLQGKLFSTDRLETSLEITLKGEEGSSLIVFTDAISPLSPSFKDDRLQQACQAVKEAVAQYLEGFVQEGLNQEILQEAFDFAGQLCQERLAKDAITISLLVVAACPPSSQKEGEKEATERGFVGGAGDIRLYKVKEGQATLLFADPLNRDLSFSLDAAERARDLRNALAAPMQPQASTGEFSLSAHETLLVLPYGVYSTKKVEESTSDLLDEKKASSKLQHLSQLKQGKSEHLLFSATLAEKKEEASAPEPSLEIQAAQAEIDAPPLAMDKTLKQRSVAIALSLTAASLLMFLALYFKAEEPQTAAKPADINDTFVRQERDSEPEMFDEALVFELKDHNRQQQEIIELLSSEITNLKEEIKHQQAEMSSLKEGDLDEDIGEKMAVSLDDLQLQLELKNEKISHLQQTIATLENELVVLSQRPLELDPQTKQEIDTMHCQLTELQKVEQEHGKLIELLTHLQDETQTLHREIDSKDQALHQVSAKLTEEQERIKALEEEELRSRAKKAYRDSQLQVKNLQKDLKLRETVIKEQREKLNVLDTLAKSLHLNSSEPKQILTVVTQLQQQAAAENASKEALKMQLSHLVQEKDLLQTECHRLTNKSLEIDELLAKNQVLQQQKQAMQKALSDKESAIAALSGDLQDLKTDRQFLEEEKQATLQRLYAAEDIQRQYEEEHRLRLDLEETKRQLANEIQLQQQHLASLQEKQEGVQHHLDAALKKNLRLESDLALLKSGQTANLASLSTVKAKGERGQEIPLAALSQAVRPLTPRANSNQNSSNQNSASQPAPSLPATAMATAAATKRMHTVAKGETLTGIAKDYYGTTTRWFEIYEANQERIKDKNKITVGTQLVIP